MFGMLKSAVTDVAEKATGKDLDGDGDVGEGGIGGSIAKLLIPKGQTPKLADGADLPTSSCTGNKKSVFIGINYFGQKGELRGCINDVNNIKAFVSSYWNFPDDPEHMLVLTDDQEDDAKKPTHANIIAAMKWLVEGAQDGDSLFFHYSGHGASVKDESGQSDEADGMDETLVPVDYHDAGMIIDDEIHAILVAPLPSGVRITAITDCCHSGSIFDLPFTYTIDGALEVHEVDNRMVAIKAAMSAGKSLIDGDKMAAAKHTLKGVMAAWKAYQGSSTSADAGTGTPLVVRKSLADVIQFSGCRDEQTSADAHIEGEHTGAMSWAFMQAFEKHGHDQTYTELLGNIRTLLSAKYTQVPQMSTGHKMHMAEAVFKM